MFKTDKKILITGGSGALGSSIRKILDCDAPDSKTLNITSFNNCISYINKTDPDIVIHCAAWTDVAGAEKNKEGCWSINVRGTENMIRAANGRRFIYISTHYVFDGERGMYTEKDTPNPVNYYSLTKLIGEAIIGQYPNTLIIRTGLKKDGSWPYNKAFVDQWLCSDFASERAPDVVRAALMNELVGLIHISGERKSVYELARKVSPEVGEMSINDVNVKLPKDVSLDSSLWKKILQNHKRKI